MFCVAALTCCTEKTTEVVVRVVKLMTVAEPSLLSVGTFTVEPSEKVRRPAMTWSERFGRS